MLCVAKTQFIAYRNPIGGAFTIGKQYFTLFYFFLVSFHLPGQSPAIEEVVRKAYQRGELATRQGDLPEAEKDFLRVLDVAPNDVGAKVNLAVVYMRQQNWNSALKYLTSAEQLAPQVPGIRLNIGLVHYRQGDYKAAIPEFEAVLKQQPDSVQARRLLGLCFLFQEHYVEASDALEPLWSVSQNDMSYLYSLAVAAGNAGRHDVEERAENQLMAIGKDTPLVHLLMGKAYLGHEDYQNALSELRKAESSDSKLPMLHYNLGVVYRHQGDNGNARQEFLKDSAIEPNVPYNYDQLGALASLDGKDHEAEVYFSDAVKLDRKLGTSWFGLAKVYKQEKRYSDSLKALDAARALDPTSASVHYLRAQVLTGMGRSNEAKAEFAMVQELKKENVDTLEREISGAKYKDPELPAQ